MNYLYKILVTGGNGQLAQTLLHHPHASRYQIIARTHTELDITDPSAIQQAIAHYAPNIIVNAAAYTAVDKAESEIDIAEEINHYGAKNLAIACQQAQLPLIHLSTDYVFDGNKKTAYTEEDKINPLNVYGHTKWLGEVAVREHCEKHIILRVSGVFSEYGNNFVKAMLQLGQKINDLRVVNDQITCPTYAGDIAEAIFTIAVYPQHLGTYHFCSLPSTSWHDFATRIFDEARSKIPLTITHVNAVATKDYPTAAKRPLHSVLNCQKIFKDYEIKQPDWQQALINTIGKLQ